MTSDDTNIGGRAEQTARRFSTGAVIGAVLAGLVLGAIGAPLQIPAPVVTVARL